MGDEGGGGGGGGGGAKGDRIERWGKRWEKRWMKQVGGKNLGKEVENESNTMGGWVVVVVKKKSVFRGESVVRTWTKILNRFWNYGKKKKKKKESGTMNGWMEEEGVGGAHQKEERRRNGGEGEWRKKEQPNSG